MSALSFLAQQSHILPYPDCQLLFNHHVHAMPKLQVCIQHCLQYPEQELAECVPMPVVLIHIAARSVWGARGQLVVHLTYLKV